LTKCGADPNSLRKRAEIGPNVTPLGVLHDLHARTDMRGWRNLHRLHLPPSSAPGRVHRGGRETVEKYRASAIYRAEGKPLAVRPIMLGAG